MDTKPSSHMTEDPSEQLLRELDAETSDDNAARKMLADGHCIYYRNDATPPGLEIKQHPDGRRELVRFHRAGDKVIRQL